MKPPIEFIKEQTVKIKSLNAEIPISIDKLDTYHRREGRIGKIYYPVFSTLNRYWYVKHQNDSYAVYHESEIEPYEFPKIEEKIEIKRRSPFYDPFLD